MADGPSAGPLEGIRVLEFSHTVMGPVAGLILAELGADVVKIEPAPGGDTTRDLRGFAAGFFAAFNRSKRSLAVDLKHTDGQAVLHRLAEQADVVIENYGPGTMERLGCGCAALSAINPRLVYLALKGYLAGPYERRPALDEVVQFQTGLATMTGPPGQPLRAGASVVDILGGVFGVVAVQAALRARETTGRGEHIGSALFESAAFLMASHMAGMAATGLPIPPMPARQGAWAVYQVFTTQDGTPIFIGVTTDPQWRRFTDAFDLAALAADPRLATNALRLQARDWLLPALQQTFSTLPITEVTQRCQRANISWAPVAHPADLFDDPHLLAGGGLLDVLVPRSGGPSPVLSRLPALPLSFGPARPGLLRQPAGLGEHTTEILAQAGYTPAQIADLTTRQVILADR